MNEDFDLDQIEIGDILSWDNVSEIHKVRNGIYQKEGKLISLLTDLGQINPCYPDFQNETADRIFYTGAGRRGDQKLDIWNQSMIEAVKSKIKVPLFCKLSIGKWRFMGFWKVFEAKYIFEENNERMVWKFTLQKSDSILKTRSNPKDFHIDP